MSGKKVLIISAGIFPIPADSGGAVEELIDSFAEKALADVDALTITSCAYHGKKIKKPVEGVSYLYVDFPFYVKFLDDLNYFYADKIKRDWRSLFFQNQHRSKYYIDTVCRKIDLDAYDAIIVENNMSLLEKLYEMLGEAFSRKCYYHMHSNLVDNPAMVPYLAKCRKILVVSDFVKDLLYSTVPEFADTEIVKITNGIRICQVGKEREQRIRMRMRQRYHIAEDETVYLFAGRVSAEKGVYELVQAFIEAGDALQKCRLVIVGSAYSGSNEINHYMKRILELAAPYRDRILITGYVPHKYVLNYHIMSDVQVVPSIMEDPAPLTVLEGMSMGLYMLLSNVGGIPEYSRNYRNRMMLERDDHFVENIRDALTAYHQQYPANGYEKQRLFFDRRSFYNEFISEI
ncbi:glycosyltransferase family 4 protein [Ruminococcus sp.]|uniref:glycosyltransferase family 4 protein n=1 Tax=Ruminococcus sp. TaxID=41978 RepID=UPI002E7844BE|nr:glycosyltransferase family 4 protein [Ruminococcus sp.]MEE1396870.1 glycosyltransferase family 4 protein [Ruminococcus sp.]